MGRAMGRREGGVLSSGVLFNSIDCCKAVPCGEAKSFQYLYYLHQLLFVPCQLIHIRSLLTVILTPPTHVVSVAQT